MFHPLRLQRERTAIPQRSPLGELDAHFNLVLSSLPQAQTCSLKIIIFISPSKPWTLGSIESADFYGLEKKKEKRKQNKKKILTPAERACCARVRFVLIFGGCSNGDSRDGAEGVAAMTGGLSVCRLQ